MPKFLVLLLMQVTIFSSVTALILIAVKQIFKCRIPPLIGTMMWVVLLARLVCPIFPESAVSVYNFIPVGRDIMFTLTYDVGESLEEQEEAFAERENPYVLTEIVPETDPSEHTAQASGTDERTHSLGEYLTEAIADGETDTVAYAEMANIVILSVYVLGIAVMLTYHIAAYFRVKKMALLLSLPCEDEDLLTIYRNAAASAGISPERLPEVRTGISSMVIGCVKPCIICREGTDEREAGMMFAHELIHYKHHDNALLLFATVIACFYWYNPLIWIVRAMLREDIEVLCDSRTLEECGIVGTDYAMMLCRNSAFSELAYTAGCHMSASGRHLKNRLRTISLRTRRNFLSRAGSILLCTVIMMLCLTNPIVSQSSEYSVYIEHYAALTGEDERSMHLQTGVTVSTYLDQIGALVTEKAGEEVWQKIGGNLEKFKRICTSSEFISDDVKREVRKLKTDELLTNKSCALITDCMVGLLSGGNDFNWSGFLLLPDVITVADMNALLVNLTESEANAVLSCYNQGVRGADVQFDRFYTSAMMDLILSRINDDWLKLKFRGFYQKIESDRLAERALSTEMLAVRDTIGTEKDFYILDPNTTEVEKNVLRDILRAASAGEDENVYYRKDTEDGCEWRTAAFLFYRAGHTYADMFRDYAEIGENNSVLEVNAVAYPVLCDAEDVVLQGMSPAGVQEALLHVYSLGILDADAGILDPSERLSRGESLAAAYRLVYFAVGTGSAVN